MLGQQTMSGIASQDVQVAAMRRMEEKIRVLVEDLESEQKLRRRVEREKQDLQMQVRLPELKASVSLHHQCLVRLTR